MKTISNKFWYVAQLKPNGFHKAQLNLHQQGFECFMPMRKVTIKHARKFSNDLRPVFPGYIFIRFALTQGNWRKINSTLGVNKLISFKEGLPTRIPEALIAGLQDRCDKKNILKPINDWQSGETARVVSGVFSDFIVQIDELLTGDRIRLLFEYMGQNKKIEVSSNALERLF